MNINKKISKNIYDTAVYLRLSDEDDDVSRREKSESESIANQKNLILDFLKTKTNINIAGEYVDDGVSGSSFSRPAFNKMMEDIEAGRINCVVVKDLSRFGREYIDAGNLLERVFPSLGVRFISVNDSVDTLYGMDSLTIALKNIMNDIYCRDISIKVRSNLAVKRNHGEFIGSFTIYGYEKSPNNKNKLVIDEYAASVVQNIFLWRIQGNSCNGIAKKLNEMGILTPYDYKINHGLLYRTSFKEKDKSVWEGVTVRRILENEMYTGCLIQGKWTTANHKVKKPILKDESQWARIENAQEAIVDKRDFELVQKVLKLDTRTASGEETCYPLSGMMVCADCQSNMVRRPRKNDGKFYVYYDCFEHNNTGRCKSHNVRESKMEETVLAAIKSQIALVIKLDDCIKRLDLTMLTKLDSERLNGQITTIEADLMKYRGMSKTLYEDLYAGIITKEDYITFKADFEMKKKQAEKTLAEAKIELDRVKNQNSKHYRWVDQFIKYQDVGKLTRAMVIELVDGIVIHDKNHVEITLSYQDEFMEACKELEKLAKNQNMQNDFLEEVCVCG